MKNHRLNPYQPPGSKTFLPVKKKSFRAVARAAGFTTMTQRQIDAMADVGCYLKEEVGAENLGITYIARSHEMSEVLATTCDAMLAKAESMEDRVALIKLLQSTAKQLADNGKLLIASQHLAIQSEATIIQTNRSAPPGSVAIPVSPPGGITVQVESHDSKTDL